MKKNVSVLFFLFSVLLVKAQTLSPTVINNYPSSVVFQVFDFFNKTNIEAEKQVAIADIIVERDNAIHTLLKEGALQSNVVTVKSQYDDKINALLDLEEKYNKYVKGTKELNKDKYSYTQFAIAIRFKDSLELSPAQYQTMLNYADSLKLLKKAFYAQNKSSLDSRAYESERMTKALSNPQYDRLLTLKNSSKAEMLAETDWKELEQRGIDSSFNKPVALAELTRYYLARENTYNKYQHDLVKQKMQTRELYANRPTVIRVLQKIRRNPDNDTATKIFKW
jgi:hypothetical protein